MFDRKTMFGLGLVAIAVVGAAPAALPQSAGKAERDIQWLAVQTASGYRFDGKTIVLDHVNPSTTLFTDRPVRIARQIATGDFPKVWQGGQPAAHGASDPANAGITFVVDGHLQTATVEIQAPKIDGNSLSYAVKVIEGQLPATGGETSVFIDDIFWNPGGMG